MNIKFNKNMYLKHSFILVNEDVFEEIMNKYKPNSSSGIGAEDWKKFKNANANIQYSASGVGLSIEYMAPGTYKFVCKSQLDMGGTITII